MELITRLPKFNPTKLLRLNDSEILSIDKKTLLLSTKQYRSNTYLKLASICRVGTNFMTIYKLS